MLAARIFDSIGIYGNVMHHAIVIFFVGSALMLFLYLWSKDRLDMDDEPAQRMMQMSDEQPEKEGSHGTSQDFRK